MKIRALFATVAIISSAACVPVATRQRAPLKVTYDVAERSALWNSAILVLQEQNYPIQLLDQASGTITTGEVGGFSISQGPFEISAKETVSLTISPTGSMVVNVNRFHLRPGTGTWSGPQTQIEVDSVEARQKQIAVLIRDRAKAVRAAHAAPLPEVAPPAPSAPASEAVDPTPDAATSPAAQAPEVPQ